MKQLFNTEEEAITWVGMNIALAIISKNKAKTLLVSPFTSAHAHSVVVENLGRELFKYQQEEINKL